MKSHVIESAKHLERQTMDTPLEAHIQAGDARGGIEARNLSSKQPTLFLSNTWSATEAKYSVEEKYFCLAYRFWPALKEVAGAQKLIFFTPLPSIKEATKQTTAGAKAMMSGWGKWQIMIVDPQVEFQTEGQVIRRAKMDNILLEEKPQTPNITLFTDGSFQGKDEKAPWVFKR